MDWSSGQGQFDGELKGILKSWTSKGLGVYSRGGGLCRTNLGTCELLGVPALYFQLFREMMGCCQDQRAHQPELDSFKRLCLGTARGRIYFTLMLIFHVCLEMGTSRASIRVR